MKKLRAEIERWNSCLLNREGISGSHDMGLERKNISNNAGCKDIKTIRPLLRCDIFIAEIYRVYQLKFRKVVLELRDDC